MSSPDSVPDDRVERPLPLDADIEADESPTGSPLPIHLTPHLLALVAVGGAFGSVARHLSSDALGSPGRFPLGTFSVNVIGAFALGVLLEWLARDGPDAGHRRMLRLLLGTGFLGGFTTYSAFAVDFDALIRDSHVWLAGAYALATVAVGFAATIAGIAVSRRATR
jgi:CrcB protein